MRPNASMGVKEHIKPEKFQELLKQIEEDDAKSYNPEKKKKEIKDWMKPENLKKWMKQNKIKEDDLEFYHTELVTFSYGNKDKTPLENVKFYQENTSVKLRPDEISAMLPTEFEQVYVRLYWKGTKDKKPNKKILDKFHNMKEEWADFVPTKMTEV